MTPRSDDITDAAAAVRLGGVIVLPTDTVYGLGSRTTQADAIDRIYELKGRDEDKPLQVLVPAHEWLDELAEPSPEAKHLAKQFWPGPLTIVVSAGRNAPVPVVQDGKIGLRMPAHPVALELLIATGPLAATSANISGEPTPETIEELQDLFGDRVDAYLGAGRIDGRASTVVDLSGPEPQILRAGALPPGAISHALGRPIGAG